MAKYNLENNPLWSNSQNEHSEDTGTTETENFSIPSQEEAIKEDERKISKGKGRPKNPDIIHEGVQSGLTAEFTRATLILRVDLLDDLKNYAYTERISIKDAVNQFLRQGIEAYKNNGNQLLNRNKNNDD